MAEALTDQQAMTTAADSQALQATQSANPIDTFARSKVVQHFLRLGGIALAVALGTVVVLWSFEPNYTPLYANIESRDAAEIANILDVNDIAYKIDPQTGTILVEQGKAAEARLKLAAEGLPAGTTMGLEILQQDQSLGTSQFIETARYNHALEAELARSIESIRSVESARVHLALPKQSIFIRNRQKPSASVVTKLYAGRQLTPNQVEAIVHMVASSVPMMTPEQVTLVDQFGRLLTEDRNSELSLSNKQFEYNRKLENNYADRIVQLLQPIVGEGKVNAQVSAQLEFSKIESTREAYDPERSVVRSEQVSEQETRDLNQALGIPGALTNQPPGAGTTDPEQAGGQQADGLPASQNRSSTRNYEVDRTISHTRNPGGNVQRLSVAVVLDSKTRLNEDGTVEKIAWNDQELQQFESLVREAIGFDANRGDSVSIINSEFIASEPQVVELPWWQSLLGEDWLVTLIKQVLGAIGLLIVYLMFLRPFLRSLKPEPELKSGEHIDPETGEVVKGELADDQATEDDSGRKELTEDPNSTAALIRRSDATHDQKVEMARTLVLDDPVRVANVIRAWVGQDQ